MSWWRSFRDRFIHGMQKKHDNALHLTKPTQLALSQVMQAKSVARIPRMEQILQFPRLLNQKERRIAGLAAIVFIICIFGAGWILYNAQRITIPVNGGTFTEGIVGSPQLMNPLYASANDVDSDLVTLLFSGLMTHDAQGNLIPDLAQSFSISEDQKEYTFILKENATWHDGEPVRVADIIFTFNALQNNAYRSPLQSLFTGINITQIDEWTVKFTLSEPFSPFLSLLTIGILPVHIWDNIQAINAASAEPNRTPIGSGPYRLKTVARDGNGNIRSFLLTAHDGYHGKKPYIQKITLKFYSDLDTALDAVKNKNVDGLAYIPLLEVQDIQRMNHVNIQTPLLQQYTGIYFNQQKQGLFKDKNMRSALHIGVDRKKLIEDAFKDADLSRPIIGPILKGMPGFQEEEILVYNPEEAKKLLHDLGWVLPEGELIRKKGNDSLRLILTIIDTPELVAVANELQNQYKIIGIDLVINPVSSQVLQTDILGSRDYEMLLTGVLLGTDPDLYPFWHSSQAREPGLNLAQFVDRKADLVIEKARETNDTQIRSESYHALNTILRDSLPAIFLYQPVYPYALAHNIQGFSLHHLSLPDQRFDTISDWYIKTKRVFRRNE